MTGTNLIVELAAWGFDQDPDRPDVWPAESQRRADEVLAEHAAWDSRAALVRRFPAQVQHSLIQIAEREDFQREFEGLDWDLGVVDFRRLVSFQRRLSLRNDSLARQKTIGWAKRMEVAFPPPRDAAMTQSLDRNGLTLSSENPDFTIRLNAKVTNNGSLGISIHHGSPFLEVGQYGGRWFLRDGYHRAYCLLQSGVFTMPAVIVRAKTLEELGADQPWFFPKSVLFSARPPLMTDFLCRDVSVRWHRPARRKVVRVTITESFEPSWPEEEKRNYEHRNQAR
jgi:hypothetical protein